MPSGRVHQNINQTILITIFLIALFSIPLPENYIPSQGAIVWFRILGLAIGINYLNPDLDKNNTHPDQHWGLYGKIWNIYAFFFKHRGISHWIVGFLTRYTFMFAMAFVFFLIANVIILLKHNVDVNNIDIIEIIKVFWNYSVHYFKTRKSIIISITAGIMSGDLLHIVEDKIGSFLKKYKRK